MWEYNMVRKKSKNKGMELDTSWIDFNEVNDERKKYNPDEEPLKWEKKKLRAAIYIRLSTKEQKQDGNGDVVQLKSIKNYIKTMKYLFPPKRYIYTDLWKSGDRKVEERDGMNRLFEDLEFTIDGQRPFDIVIVWKIDRLARSVSVLYDIIDKLQYYGETDADKVLFASVTESFDMNTPFGRASFWILWVFAEFEKDVIQERTYKWNVEVKKQWESPMLKYGYIKDENNRLVAYEEEAQRVRFMFQKYALENWSIQKICNYLEEQKILIPAVSKLHKKNRHKIKSREEQYNRRLGALRHGIYHWTDNTVRQYIDDEFYAGTYKFNKKRSTYDKRKWKRVDIKLPEEDREESDMGSNPLISMNLYLKAKEIREIWKKQWQSWPRKWKDRKYILTWLLKCDCCKHLRKDNKMSSWNCKQETWWGKHIYQCNGKKSSKFGKELRCTVLPLDQKDLEKLVLYHIQKLLRNPKWIGKLLEQHTYTKMIKSRVKNRLNRYQELYKKAKFTEKRLKELYLDGTIKTKKEYQSRKKDIVDDIKEYGEKIIESKKLVQESFNLQWYIEALELFKNILDTRLDEVFKDRQLVNNLLEYLVKEIIVYSSEVDKWIKLPWSKPKRKQHIPYRIEIIFKLPQELAENLISLLPDWNWWTDWLKLPWNWPEYWYKKVSRSKKGNGKKWLTNTVSELHTNPTHSPFNY